MLSQCKYTVDGNNFSEPELEKSRQIVTKFFFLNGIAGSVVKNSPLITLILFAQEWRKRIIS